MLVVAAKNGVLQEESALKVKCSLIKGGINFLDIREIIRDLEAERDRIERAITALRDVGTNNGKPSPNRRGGPRRLSAAARKRISEAAKKRWAKVKAAGKKRL